MGEARVRAEIEELHRFFVDWYIAALPAAGADFESRFSARLAPEFGMIVPSGAWLSREQVIASIRQSHGARPGHRIAIREVRLRPFSGERLTVATYQEWWHGADNERGALQASVILRPEGPGLAEGTRPATPGGWHWLHVHETALPDEVVAAGDFGF